MNMIQHSQCMIVQSLIAFSLLGLSACSPARPPVPQQMEHSHMNIKIEIADIQPIYATLQDSASTRDFIAQLPLELELTDYAGTEKIATLPRRLSNAGAARTHTGRAGDLTYYAPWGNLAIFYRDSDVVQANGLIYLGKLHVIPPELKQGSSLKVTILQQSED